MELSTEQQNKLAKVADFLQKTEVSNLLPFADLLEEIRDTLKVIAEKETVIPDFPTPPDVQKIAIEGVGFLKGEQGIQGIQGEQGIAGTDGTNGTDGRDGLDGQNGLDGMNGSNGLDGKEGSADTGEQIIEKINSTDSEFKITREHLDIDDIIKQLERQISSIPRGGGGGGARNAMKLYPLTANGITKTFTVPKSVAGYVVGSDFPTVWFENSGFTINNTRTQIVFTTDNAPSSGSQLLYIYSSMFGT